MKIPDNGKKSFFEKIAVAVAFSPRCESIIAEAKDLHNKFNSQIIFIHVGSKSLQHEQYLKDLISRFDFDSTKTSIIWREGDTVEQINAVCTEENVDLLVAGALEKESLFSYFLGNTARKLCRKCRCSILMLTEPSIHPVGFKKIISQGAANKKSKLNIETAIEIARAYGVKEVVVVKEADLSKLALTRRENQEIPENINLGETFISESNIEFEDLVKEINESDVSLTIENIEGKPGYVICQYAKKIEADLLVLNSSDRIPNFLDRVFPSDIEYALAELPCNVLITHFKDND